MILVILESPYSGDVEGNDLYLDACIADCLSRQESPYASHRMLTRSLDDTKPEERALGITAGFQWRKVAEKTVVYIDRGISEGMRLGVRDAVRMGHEIEYRQILECATLRSVELKKETKQ